MDNVDKYVGILEIAKDWAIWVVGIQTAAIAGIGAIFKDRALSYKRLTFVTLLAFCLSILCAVSFVGALPYLPVRTELESPGRLADPMSTSMYKEFRLPLVAVGSAMHICFGLGIVFFSLLMYRIATEPPPTSTEDSKEAAPASKTPPAAGKPTAS